MINDNQISQSPIFIVGYTRSGTSLLQSLLGTQDNLVCLPETHFFCPYVYSKLKINQNGTVDESCLNDFLKKLFEMSKLTLTSNELTLIHNLGKEKSLNIKQLFEIILKHYFNEQDNFEQIEKKRWIEKTPYHGFAMDSILSFYPNAKFVAIIRHPLPSIYSTKKYLHPNAQYESLAEDWLNIVEKIEQFKTANTDRIVILRYEDMILNVERAIQTICDATDCKFDKNSLKNFHKISKITVKSFETWKSDVLSSKIMKHKNKKYRKQMKMADRVGIMYLVRSKLFRYKYFSL